MSTLVRWKNDHRKERAREKKALQAGTLGNKRKMILKEGAMWRGA
jgi:hypothetical protein